MDDSKEICNLIDMFLRDQDIMERSRKTYENILLLFFRWTYYKNIYFKELKKSDIIVYKQSLVDKSELTQVLYLTVIKLFYKWTELNGFYKNIATGIKLPRKNYYGFKKKPLSEIQAKKLLSSFNLETKKSKRDLCIAKLMILCGLRSVEISRLNIEDLKEKNGIIGIFVQSKGKKTKYDFLNITDNTFETIESYLIDRIEYKETDPLFSAIGKNKNIDSRLTPRSISRLIKDHLLKIGLKSKKYSAHSLRHTFAVLALIAGIPIEKVSARLRHRNISTTQIYTRYIEKLYQTDDKTSILIENLITKTT